MAEHSIVTKLREELSRFTIKRESQVVYLLAEIRKLIEHKRSTDPDAYEVLELFCNWALHTSISRKSNADRIRIFLKAFDFREGMSLEDYLTSRFYQEMLKLQVFRNELCQFLHEYSLPCGVVREYRQWSGFIYLYTSVVSEAPLQDTKNDLLPDEIEQITLEHLPQPATPQKMVKWTIKLKSGKIYPILTLYGVYRDAENRVVGVPDFFFEEGFQI